MLDLVKLSAPMALLTFHSALQASIPAIVIIASLVVAAQASMENVMKSIELNNHCVSNARLGSLPVCVPSPSTTEKGNRSRRKDT